MTSAIIDIFITSKNILVQTQSPPSLPFPNYPYESGDRQSADKRLFLKMLASRCSLFFYPDGFWIKTVRNKVGRSKPTNCLPVVS